MKNFHALPDRQRTVLLVEDNRVHREITCAVLEKWGCKVVQARDGEEALARLLQNDFIMVLMDIEMPWMNGIKAAQRILEMKRFHAVPDIPIIALTADTSEETHQRCLQAGMTDVIPKHIWKPKWEQVIFAKLDGYLSERS